MKTDEPNVSPLDFANRLDYETEVCSHVCRISLIQCQPLAHLLDITGECNKVLEEEGF